MKGVKEMKEIKCEVIQDLITLYIDKLTSEESNKLIENHITTCTQCNEFLDNINDNEIIDKNDIENSMPNKDEEIDLQLIKRIQKSKINFSVILIILTCAISTGLSDGPYLFTGIIILPTLGAISYLKLRNTWIAPLTIYISNIVLMLVRDNKYFLMDLSTSESMLEGIRVIIQYILSTLTFNGIFAAFVFIGVIIGFLIQKIFIDD